MLGCRSPARSAVVHRVGLHDASAIAIRPTFMVEELMVAGASGSLIGRGRPTPGHRVLSQDVATKPRIGISLGVATNELRPSWTSGSR